jgi:hypothetical protein
MEGHEERAQEAEYELAEMEEQSDGLADDIHAAKDGWEAKKRDESVPGAGSGEDIVEPEATGEGAPEVEDERS